MRPPPLKHPKIATDEHQRFFLITILLCNLVKSRLNNNESGKYNRVHGEFSIAVQISMVKSLMLTWVGEI